MWTLDDVKLSLRRYLSLTLEPVVEEARWTIRFSKEQVRDQARPAGLIESGLIRPASGYASRAGTLQQGNVVEEVPITVTLYPELQDPREARRRADRLSQQLYDLIRFGLDLRHSETERPVAGPERIPLYDYAEVALSGTAEGRTGPEDPHDFLFADGYSANAVQDPEDPKRYSVVLELTLSWERPGRVTDVDAPSVRDEGALIAVFGEVDPSP